MRRLQFCALATTPEIGRHYSLTADHPRCMFYNSGNGQYHRAINDCFGTSCVCVICVTCHLYSLVCLLLSHPCDVRVFYVTD